MIDEYEKLKATFESRNSPVAVRLFRAKQAPLILFFLRRQFKNPHISHIQHTEMVRQLSHVLEQISYRDYVEEDDSDLTQILDSEQKAELLIKRWSDAGYITFEPDEKGQYHHALSSDTEKVIQWIYSLQKQEFISAESKFMDIFNKLREIAENSTEDWEEKVDALKARKRELEAEIRRLEIEQKVISAEDYYVKSRFNEVTNLAQSLLADFREVDENFNGIKNTIYEKQTNLELTKGNILNYTLDALDDLRNTDQGKSFEAFYRHLLDDSSKDELSELIRKVVAIMREREIEVEDEFLLHLRVYLNREGNRVRNSYHKLADKLNKVLAEKSLLERKNTIRIINEIKSDALRAKDNPPRGDAFIEIDGFPDIELSMERPLTEQPQDVQIEAKALKTADVDLTSLDLGNLVSQFFIDREQLESQIADLLKKKKQVTLKDVVEHYPVTKGLSEVLTYVNIATQSGKSFINRDKEELVVINDKGSKAIRLPEIIFSK
ncbi:MAG TPA: DUF3375 domain-containing protein [Chitinophagales bacterium]|nr:DUF3375 domain-containing protein [Chitinophagales bacterium]